MAVVDGQKTRQRQGLAIRGHDDIQGNMEQLLRLRAEDCPALTGWISDHKYVSPCSPRFHFNSEVRAHL